MSEQIREQISAFLDGELPDSETDLLLRRLTRDQELRDSFGRFSLIGEALRGSSHVNLTKGFANRVNRVLDGVPVHVAGPARQPRTPHWWRPFAGAAMAAGVAAVAVVALQQRTAPPSLHAALTVAAQNSVAEKPLREAISYTVPQPNAEARAAMPAARLTSYVFAHSKYSSGLDQRGVMADMLIEADEPSPATYGAP